MAIRWRTILVPHDFSATARRAAALAADEARVHGAELLLLHVVELMPQFGPDTTLILPEDGVTPIGIHAYFRRRAERELAQIARELSGSVTVRWIVREGVPAAEILAVVHDEPVDAIAMGTHGRSGLRRMVAGSVAERVVRMSPVPVFTTRQPE